MFFFLCSSFQVHTIFICLFAMIAFKFNATWAKHLRFQLLSNVDNVFCPRTQPAATGYSNQGSYDPKSSALPTELMGPTFPHLIFGANISVVLKLKQNTW